MEIRVGLDSFAAFAAMWIDIFYHLTACGSDAGQSVSGGSCSVMATPYFVIPQLLYPATAI
jgi:hypothetical protein